MKENEIDNLKNMEKNNTNSMNENNEKVHYEIKFVETDDGFRLEASGDKEALRRLGISPNMVGGPHRKHGRGPRGRRHGRGMHRGSGHRAARSRRRRAMYEAWQAGECGPQAGPAFAYGSPHHAQGPRRRRHAAPSYGRYTGMEMPESPEKGSAEFWDW